MSDESPFCITGGGVAATDYTVTICYGVSMNRSRGDAALGRRLRKMRLQLGCSQKALADGICTSAYISTIESGARRPSEAVLEALAERLGTTADFLLTGRSPDLAARIDLGLVRARALVVQGEASAALEQGQTLRGEARQNGLGAAEGRAEEVIGRAYLRLGSRSEALEAFRASQRLLAGEPPETRMPAVVGAARALFQMRDVHQAIHELETALLELNRRPVVDPDAALQLYGALIGPCFEAGLLSRASEAAHEVERLDPRVKDAEARACSYINVAGVYLAERRLEDALIAMSKAETLFLQVDGVVDAARARVAQALVFIEREDWEEARLRLKTALVHLPDTTASSDRARALIQLGRVERLAGDPAEAVRHLRNAVEIMDDEEHNERGLAERELGLCLVSEGDLARAQDALRRSIASYRGASNRLQEGLSWMLLGDAIRGGEGLDEVAQAYREGLDRVSGTAV